MNCCNNFMCTQKHIQYVFNREDFTFHVAGGVLDILKFNKTPLISSFVWRATPTKTSRGDGTVGTVGPEISLIILLAHNSVHICFLEKIVQPPLKRQNFTTGKVTFKYCTSKVAQRANLFNINLPRAQKSNSFRCTAELL